MKWLRLNRWVPILLLFVSQNATRAESPAEPIIAKQRQLSYETQPDGSMVLKSEQAGAFYRSSSGATMNTVGFLSAFSDEQGNAYEINHNKRIAIFVEHHQVPLHEFIKNKIAPESIKGYEMVNGLNCAVQTTLLNGKPAGKSYLYLPYGLWVKTEHTDPAGSHLMVRELYDIEVAEPDAALLRIPEGYSVDNQPEQ
jgi:hypothetical protein